MQATLQGLVVCNCSRYAPWSFIASRCACKSRLLLSLHSTFTIRKQCLASIYREQQLAQGHNTSSTTRLGGGSSLATLSQLSKSSNNSNTVGANSRADRWHRLRSTSYHMHDCGPAHSSSNDHNVTSATGTGANGTAYGCGVMFSEAETQSLNQLLVATVDVLVDSGSPNVSSN